MDEYGGTMGMATLENVLEELVGPIEDEFDQEETLIRQTSEDTWELSGTLPAHRLAGLVGERFDPTGEACTVSGLVMQRLSRFPRTGDALALGDMTLRVEELAGTRVARMKLTRRTATAEGASDDPFAQTRPDEPA